jgi:ABC-type nitrate/sulfonate/bicarbonate transport system substrate-binding protein
MTDLVDAPSEMEGQLNTLWYSRCPVPTASGIAQHYCWLQRSFAEIGIALNSIRAADERDTRDAHLDHAHEGMFREGGNIPAIWARAKGQDTVVVAITWVDEQQAIVALPDSDIHTAADLRGRRLGVPKTFGGTIDFSRAMGLHGLITALQVAGLGPVDATLVDIAIEPVDLRETLPGTLPLNPVLDALLAGTVDAIYLKGAQGAAVAARHGLRIVLNINSHPDPRVRINNGTPRPVTVDRALAVARPDLVARYLALLLRTAEWANTHPGEVVAAVAAETGTRPEDVLRAYGPDFHHHFQPRLSPAYVAALEEQKNFLRDWGFLAGDFSVPSWIAPEPLRQAEALVSATGSSQPALDVAR